MSCISVFAFTLGIDGSLATPRKALKVASSARVLW